MRSFYNKPTLTVAKQLLGKFLVKDGKIGQINEVEAYVSDIDPACHAYNGMTKRTKVMFGPSGYSYVYFIYGMYFCFNVVTEKEGKGCAVLIRGVKPVSGFDKEDYLKTDGPGKLCKAFGITKKDNGIDLCTSKDFFIEDRGCKVENIKRLKRIGINKGTEFEWRFVCKL
jgi:DNA-3-methyladenine glycosylase